MSRPLWFVGTIVALSLWHRQIFDWASDGPGHTIIGHLAELKLLIAGVFVLCAGGLRLARRYVAGRRR